jgi:hypothetical protein
MHEYLDTGLQNKSKEGGLMFARVSNSWQLVKASAAVLRADKELVIFPIISMIGVLIVTVTFAIPLSMVGFFEAVAKEGGQVLGFVVLFLFYVVMYCIIIFANTALVGAAMIRLDGGDPTVSDGLHIAVQRFGTILGYALIAATVGMILRAIRERGGILGQIASSLLGFAWNLATFLVVPVLVVEDVGPIDAIQRSARLLKRTWGEQIVGNLSIGLVFVLIGIIVTLLGLPVIALAVATGSVAVILPVVLLFILALVTVGLLGSTLSGIYSAAVYRYAVDGETGGFFSVEMIEDTFRIKQ